MAVQLPVFYRGSTNHSGWYLYLPARVASCNLG